MNLRNGFPSLSPIGSADTGEWALPDFSDPLCPTCGTALRLRPLLVYNPVTLRREQIDELLWCPNGDCDFAFPLKELVRKTIAA